MELIKLFEPATINGCELKNRIVMPSMGLGYTMDYSYNERFGGFYLERAKGGAGLLFVGPVAMDKNGSLPMMMGLFEDSQVPPVAGHLKQVHDESDCKMGVQLMHMGRNAWGVFNKMQPLAPSAIPSPIFKDPPRPMEKQDIEKAKKDYVTAALRSVEAGFDIIEVLACTGYLISQFLSPITNLRDDEYGGSLENRMRFGLEIITAVRKALGPDVPMGIRVAGHDFMEGGNTNVESALFCAEAEKAGVDFINVTGGWHETNVPQLTTGVPPGAFVYLARGIKEKVSVPVLASNRLGDPMVAEKALRSGSCDFICMGRPLITDPELPNKAMHGRSDEIVPCIACNQGCFDAVFNGVAVGCILNPRAGHENEFPPKKATEPKKVLVAGGGPAGMQAALTAALMGHSVTLCEKSPALGGQVNLARAAPGKEEFGNLVTSLANRLHAARVDIRLNTPVTKQLITKENPQVLMVASGAKPLEIKVPGVDKPHVVSAWDVLAGKVVDIGKNVVVIGGSATGCETAHWIAEMDLPDAATCAFLSYHQAENPAFMEKLHYESGRKVTVVDMVKRMAGNMGKTSRWPLMKSLSLVGVAQKPEAKLLEITDEAVIVLRESGKEEIPADTVVMAVGAAPVNDLANEDLPDGVKVITIGDAKQPRKISDAIKEGFEAAYNL